MTIPVESSEVFEFTPDSLKSLIDPPVFRLRSPDERHMRRYNQMLGDDNLTLYSDKQFDAEKRVAIAELWGDEGQEIVDKYATIRAKAEQKIELSKEEVDWIEELDSQLFDNWRPLSRMRRKNDEWFEYAPRYAIATIVRGWNNFTVPFKLDAGYLKTDLVRKIAAELADIEQKARAEKVDGIGADGTAFLQLWVACLDRTRLTEDEEKNSPAPSQPSLNQDASMATGQKDAASIAESGEASSASSSSTKPEKPESA